MKVKPPTQKAAEIKSAIQQPESFETNSALRAYNVHSPAYMPRQTFTAICHKKFQGNFISFVDGKLNMTDDTTITLSNALGKLV